jgi:hypothetical protein
MNLRLPDDEPAKADRSRVISPGATHTAHVTSVRKLQRTARQRQHRPSLAMLSFLGCYA